MTIITMQTADDLDDIYIDIRDIDIFNMYILIVFILMKIIEINMCHYIVVTCKNIFIKMRIIYGGDS